MSSASPGPMLWTSRSEKRWTSLFWRAATVASGPVLSFGVWQRTQPTFAKICLPLPIESEPPGFVVDGVGGARKRMKNENFVTALEKSGSGEPGATSVGTTVFGTVAN